ncbi:gliding motility-associated C-terminal domain-containing protein [Sphingobacterium nematocida]|uniref:Gliding motility-associated C-terminal domain-containing protein n=1 Tax=Sphingobacterium nematocida TaxID=1513896 RepID=A0A1T5GU08_9SPHI|nr:gliding motility-associated C-terminal domain-containing protein [Sphingobacterium nematocida]SKC11864.1 gliding motility-associated C-terminal domain-containing protein [Sphingobacterium nematocida]
MNIKIKVLLLGLLLVMGGKLSAQQQGAGSFLSDNGRNILTENQFDAIYTESLFIGPNAEWVIDGQLDLYVKNIWIAPTAKISGAGVINIHNPRTNPFYDKWADQPTYIDANNGNYIDVRMVLLNDNGLHLQNISGRDYEDNSFPTKEKAAALRLSKAIDLRVNGANVFLNGNDFELDVNAQILNYSTQRLVVTGNSVSGHLIKNFSDRNSSFVFPVGKEELDYTPARLTPSVNKSKVYVSVTDYLASGMQFKDETVGMDRVWSIYADKGMKMDYTLIHNVSSNGVAYVDPEAQIVQDADGGNWIGNVTVFNDETGPGGIAQSMHTRKDIETRTAKTLSGTWFTKFANAPPKAVDDYVTLEFGKEKEINVLENDTPGSSAIVTNSVTVVLPPANGTVRVVNGAIIYTPNPGFIGTDEFEYEITDENGLTAKARVFVTVAPRELFIPNVFTPNGDDKNETFEIVGIEAYDRIELIVVNRWGNEVYKNSNYKNEWNGQGLNEGTYFYIISAAKGNDVRVFKGNVLIKR